MDEQENGKIGFNYVHFLFSIATSEIHRFECRSDNSNNPSSWMNEWDKCACGSSYVSTEYLEIGAEFLFEVWIAKRSHNLTFSSRVFTFSHDRKLVFDVTYCETAIIYSLYGYYFSSLFFTTTTLLLNRDALSPRRQKRIFTKPLLFLVGALLHPPLTLTNEVELF